MDTSLVENGNLYDIVAQRLGNDSCEKAFKKKIKVLFWFLKHKQNKTLTVIKFFFFSRNGLY